MLHPLLPRNPGSLQERKGSIIESKTKFFRGNRRILFPPLYKFSFVVIGGALLPLWNGAE